MNFALIVDKCKVSSYTVRDNKAYKLSNPDIPYQFHHSISNECFMGFWGYPFVFNGHFINWSEWDTLPNLDLDLIFIAIESNYDKYTIKELRSSYPNAIIIAVIKETWNWKSQWQQRLMVYDQCDHIFSCISDEFWKTHLPELLYCKKPVSYLPQPVNIDYLYDNFYTEMRNETIFSYYPVWNSARIGQTKEYTEYISNKYNIPYIRTHTNDHTNQWLDFLKIWTTCTFHFNLDPMASFPGQQAMQCAALGVIHLGGENDAHKLLWPDTATNDTAKLEEMFQLYVTNLDARNNAIQYAYNMVCQTYSYQSIYTKTNKLIYENFSN